MFVFYTWGGAWGLPSLDPFCLQVEVYLSLVGAEWMVHRCSDPSVSPTGELPLLCDGEDEIAGAERIIQYLSRKGYDLNNGLDNKDKALCHAYSALLNDKVHDAQLYAWFAEPENYIGMVLPAYASLLPFPVRYFEPARLSSRARTRLAVHSVALDHVDRFASDRRPTDPFWRSAGEKPTMKGARSKSILEEIYPQAYKLGKNGYEALSRKLGDSPFFFGSEPTTLDVIAYGHLSLHIYPRLPRDDLSKQLSMLHKNLVDFCDRMQERIARSGTPPISQPGDGTEPVPLWLASLARFPSLLAKSVLSSSYLQHAFSIRRHNKVTKQKTPSEVSFERKKWISIASGLSAVVVYVIANGMVRMGPARLDRDENEDRGWQEEEDDGGDDLDHDIIDQDDD